MDEIRYGVYRAVKFDREYGEWVARTVYVEKNPKDSVYEVVIIYEDGTRILKTKSQFMSLLNCNRYDTYTYSDTKTFEEMKRDIITIACNKRYKLLKEFESVDRDFDLMINGNNDEDI